VPGLIDDVILPILTHPQAGPAVIGIVRDQLGVREQNPYEAIQRRLDELEAEVVQVRTSRRGGRPRKAAAGADQAGSGASPSGGIARLHAAVQGISAELDEALRFARDPNGAGAAHPDARERLDAARGYVDTLHDMERFILLPERTEGQDRAVAESVLPQVRRLREVLDGGLGTLAEVQEASAIAGRLSTALQVARMTGRPPAPDTSAAVYAARRERGCIPCARSHLGFVAGSLGQAAKESPAGMGGDVAARIDSAQRELRVMLAHDWTPDRIAANPPAERDLIQRYRPLAEAMLRALGNVRTPEDVAAAAGAAQDLWRHFDAETRGMGEGSGGPGTGPSAAATIGEAAGWARPLSAVGEADALIDPAYRSWGYVAPRRDELPLIAERTDYGELMRRVVRATEEHAGWTWQTVDPREMEQIAPGAAALTVPEERVTLRTPAVLSPENRHAQTVIHEAAHILLQSPGCFPEGTERPLPPGVRDFGEREADLVTIAVMSQLGLPLEFVGGGREAAGDYTLDWDALRQHLGQREEARVRWAADWIVRAAQDGTPPPADTCPPPPQIAFVRTASGRRYGYGLA
jgi:hypothetical protein